MELNCSDRRQIIQKQERVAIIGHLLVHTCSVWKEGILVWVQIYSTGQEVISPAIRDDDDTGFRS